MREFLEEKGFTKEIINEFMEKYGKEFNSLKEENSKLLNENNNFKEKNKNYETTINELNNKILENEETLKNLQVLTNENKDLKAEIQLGGSNVKKEFSKFVKSEVMSKVDDKTDFATALENYKKESPQYFGDTVIKKVQSSPNLNHGGNQATTTNDIMNNILRGAKDEN